MGKRRGSPSALAAHLPAATNLLISLRFCRQELNDADPWPKQRAFRIIVFTPAGRIVSHGLDRAAFSPV